MMRQIVLICTALLSAAAAGASVPAKPSDAQIVQIVETVNDNEINVSEAAAASANKEVRELAEEMITQHRDLGSKVDAVAGKNDIKKEESTLSVKMKASGALRVASLKVTPDASFDKKYLDLLIDDHEAALKTFDRTLIPNAKNQQLKALLASARKQVALHLEKAKHLQAELAR